MLESSAPEPKDKFPDDLTPRPLEDLLDDRDMPPPPMIQITPLSLNSIWDSDMVMKYTDDVTGRKKWRCGHCGQEWFEHNATKALGHVVGIVKDIKSCKGVIAPRYKEAYINLYRTKYDTKAFQCQTIAKLNASLDTTDLRTISTLSKRGKKGEYLWKYWMSQTHPPLLTVSPQHCYPPLQTKSEKGPFKHFYRASFIRVWGSAVIQMQ